MRSAKEYADLLITESKKPESERQFTIANVPVKMRGEVGHLLRKEFGGNESDKKLGQIAQTIALSVPVASASTMIASAVPKLAITPGIKKFILDSIVGLIGGKVLDKAVEIDSEGKYKTFGGYVYDVSGLKSSTENT